MRSEVPISRRGRRVFSSRGFLRSRKPVWVAGIGIILGIAWALRLSMPLEGGTPAATNNSPSLAPGLLQGQASGSEFGREHPVAESFADSIQESPLRLLSTVVLSSPALSRAMIRNQESGVNERVGVSDRLRSLEGAIVRTIERRRVQLEHRGRVFWLEMISGESSAPRRSREMAEHRRAVGESVLKRISEEADAPSPRKSGPLLTDADVRLERDAEGELSILLKNVVPGGFYDRIGLLDGDRIRKIGGAPPDARAQLAPLLKNLVAGEAVSVEIQRADAVVDEITVRGSDYGTILKWTDFQEGSAAL